jgi:hypothetical protein
MNLLNWEPIRNDMLSIVHRASLRGTPCEAFIMANIQRPPVTMYALMTRHMKSLRWLAFEGMDFEVRPTSPVCRNRLCRGSRKTEDFGRTSKSKLPDASQRKLVM